jgi:hypothetical protein
MEDELRILRGIAFDISIRMKEASLPYFVGDVEARKKYFWDDLPNYRALYDSSLDEILFHVENSGGKENIVIFAQTVCNLSELDDLSDLIDLLDRLEDPKILPPPCTEDQTRETKTRLIWTTSCLTEKEKKLLHNVGL